MKEQEIIEALIRRDEGGAAAFLQAYTPLLRYVIAPILPSAQDQEECLSEVALRVWEGIASFDPRRGPWTAWLTAVARNAALNRARRLQPAAEPLPLHAAAPGPTPEEALLLREQKEALRRAMARLSPAERQLLYRKYYYRQPTAQIAAELRTTVRAVEGKLYRAKKRLRRLMGGDWYG